MLPVSKAGLLYGATTLIVRENLYLVFGCIVESLDSLRDIWVSSSALAMDREWSQFEDIGTYPSPQHRFSVSGEGRCYL
jgi:hypothetical protein